MVRTLVAIFPVTVVLSAFAWGQEGGYADKMSVVQGDSIGFHISTSINPFEIQIFRQDSVKVQVGSFSPIEGGVRSVPDSASWYGCGWPLNFSFMVPDSWTPGIYTAEFPCSRSVRSIVFSVRQKVPGSFSKILLGLTENTWQAYNLYGGHDLYLGPPFYKVSFNRPFDSEYGSGSFNGVATWTKIFLTWLERANVQVEVATNFDLHSDPRLLDNYSVYIVVGHDEYWSRPERLEVEQFLKRGGKVIILAGNTCWWQVRYEDAGRTLVCYKDAKSDPLDGITDSLVTVNWSSPPVNYPENVLTGVSWRNGGYVNDAPRPFFPHSQGYGDYAVFNSHDWVFQGTGLNDGDLFGWNAGIVGYETDGALFAWKEGIPVVTGADSTPPSFRILGVSPASYGHTTMGVYRNAQGGAVFNASTSKWVLGLPGDTIVQRITRNVLRRFVQNRFPPDIDSWYPCRVISDSLHHELVQLNKRSLAIPEGVQIRFGIHAVDPSHQQIGFFWKDNDVLAADDSTYTFTGLSNDSSSVVAFAYNSEDTTFIQWQIYNSKLRIVSEPPAAAARVGDQYYYKLDAASYYGDLLSYALVLGPPWISVDSGGALRSLPIEETGNYVASVRVQDQHGDSDMQTIIIKVGNAPGTGSATAPYTAKLLQNYPNPFNSSTIIGYELLQATHVTLKVFNSLGQDVAMLVNGDQHAGDHEVRFDGAGLASGMYFYRIQAGDFAATKKLILLK